MLIGVDFDNTIVRYDGVFHQVAFEQGLIPVELERSKDAVRDYLRAQGLEETWIEMQGYVYGARINEAMPFEGAPDFFHRCKEIGVDVCIISHKTRNPYAGPKYDLHQATRGWLKQYGFLEGGAIGLPTDRIFLELTKEDKLRRIAQTGCTHFIDDLPEFLSHPDFPEGVERILFDPAGRWTTEDRFQRARSWSEMESTLLRARESAC